MDGAKVDPKKRVTLRILARANNEGAWKKLLKERYNDTLREQAQNDQPETVEVRPGQGKERELVANNNNRVAALVGDNDGTMDWSDVGIKNVAVVQASINRAIKKGESLDRVYARIT